MNKPDSCKNCPLYSKGKGFVLGNGDPARARVAVMLEAPGQTELSWKVDDAELNTRCRDYHDVLVPMVNKRMGSAAVGKSGMEMDMWVLKGLGVDRRDVFVDNVLRCLPEKGKGDSQYPIGEERKAAEAHCRVYDRWAIFKPTLGLISLHPAAILRDPVPLPLQISDFKKALDFAHQGERPVILAGGKAAELFLGRGGINMLRLRGSYERNTPQLAAVRDRRRAEGLAIDFAPKPPKVPKVKKPRKKKGAVDESVQLEPTVAVETGGNG